MKYLKALIAFLLFSAFFVTCKESPIKKSVEEPVQKEHFQSTKFVTDSIIGIQSVAGFYQGVFPCTDCDGMEQVLFLKNNFTYKQAFVNVDSNKVFSASNGEWKIEDNRIILSKNIDYYISFGQRDDSLFAVDIDLIQLRDPGMYGLGKREFAGDQPYWESERKKGISFAGRGTDPNWNLNIKDSIIYFKLNGSKKMVISEKEKTESTETAITYYLFTNNKNWTVTIKDQFCKSGLSGDMYEYEVLVNYNGNDYIGCGIDLSND